MDPRHDKYDRDHSATAFGRFWAFEIGHQELLGDEAFLAYIALSQRVFV
jgi:hypothetical protein